MAAVDPATRTIGLPDSGLRSPGLLTDAAAIAYKSAATRGLARGRLDTMIERAQL